ncbi:MAG TPA: carboxypeptidase regulatory-like domain-containing protein [Bryobacteraceae bacterium]|nr:carboxypeptidase regulatory-like domain-containing protein [Bryobacteraceae bacterium]
MTRFTRAALLGFLISASAWCQATAGLGTISGTVRDASGSAVPAAKVVVSNTALGVTREIVTTDAGIFVAPALVPATGYKVKIEKAGFAAYEAVDISLQVGETVNLSVALTVGAVTQSVDVTAVGTLVDDTKTELSAIVDNRMIAELPINGRRVDQFVTLAPGVTKDADFGLVTFRGIAGGNSFLIDGNDTTNQYYNENAGRTRLGAQISQDAVQEFQVLTASYSAEFGRASGGVVNTITKSGTNDFHGTFFWFFRNRTLDAIDRYSIVNNTYFNPPEVRHQTGGTIGGPIVKDKLFAFFDTEIQRRTFPMVDTIINPNVSQSTQAWIGCTTPATPAQCAAINSVLPRLFGLTPRNGNQSLYFLKLDYRPNEHHSFSASMNYLKWLSMNGIQTGIVSTSGAAVGTNGDDSVRDRIGKLQWTWVPSGRVVNEARFGWFKDRQADDFDPALQAGYPIGNVSLSVAGVGTLGGYNILPRILPSENRYQWVDNLSWVKGSHTFKFGFDIARTEDFSNSLSNRAGTFTYSNVTTFAQDFTNPAPGPSHWSTYSQVFGNPIVDTTITDLGFYAQDTWKITPKLTANYGLRYEYSVLPQPPITNPNYPQTGHIPSAGKNFAPRIGLAYSINSKTVVRAGYGLYYARYISAMISNFFTLNDLYTQSLTIQSPTTAGAPIYPIPLTSPAGALASNRAITFAAPNMRNPYTEQLDVAIERALPQGMTLTVGYIMNRGKRLFTVRDLNIGPLSSQVYNFNILDSNFNPTGQVYSTPLYLLANRVDTRYGHINQVENGGKQWYDAMTVQLNKRFNGTFQGGITYTWSHELDENQESGSNAIFFSSGPMGLYNGSYSLDKGNGNLDQRHRFNATLIARPKFMKSNNAFAKYVVNGWELAGIGTLASRRPIFESVPFSSTINLPQAFTGTLDGLGGDSRVPFLPNNPLHSDPITRGDARLSKTFPIRENMPLTLLFEVFNLTNTMSNTGVITTGYTAANKGTAAVPNFVIAPCGSATATTCAPTTPGLGSASAGFPDGTNARRAQVGVRFTF